MPRYRRWVPHSGQRGRVANDDLRSTAHGTLFVGRAVRCSALPMQINSDTEFDFVHRTND
ncbi:MAG: hypothetical protein QOI59_5876 [Gammaproteobacteria bacterium]|jgi:hypothetical protein|nr:hypothetical protein [Gammaproteobacteria bacterium]